MIEVEKKFLLDKEQEKNLLEGAEFIAEKIFTDTYWDTADYQLTTNDNWLRERSGKWELKLSLDKAAGRRGDFYDEIEYEDKIKEFLKISGDKSTENLLLENGYSKFCVCKTTRKKYKKDGFGIDIDFAGYEGEDFNYQLAEIELMVQDKSEMVDAMGKIISFAEKNGLKSEYVRGKVLVYLKEKSPEHFNALVKAGVVKSDQI
jgi:adenylate cyclase class IV